MKYLLAIGMLSVCFSSHAALIKWVDADGKVQYSDTAPPDVRAQKLKSPAAGSAADSANEGAAAPKSLAERNAEWKKSQLQKEEAADKAAKEQENASIKQKNCDAARSNLAGIENNRRVVKYSPDGERTLLDDSARAQAAEEARQAVSRYCN